ncbi:hypothetical protein J6590_059145, partial [Homalodisca vitripennis]
IRQSYFLSSVDWVINDESIPLFGLGHYNLNSIPFSKCSAADGREMKEQSRHWRCHSA